MVLQLHMVWTGSGDQLERLVWSIHCGFAPISGTWEGMAGRLGSAEPCSCPMRSLQLGVLQSCC